jgi:hypothetical protein
MPSAYLFAQHLPAYYIQLPAAGLVLPAAGINNPDKRSFI